MVGFVEVVLFNDTVRNNIAYGAMRELSDGEVLRAAHAAHVMEFVRTLPQGLETLIGAGPFLIRAIDNVLDRWRQRSG